MRCFLFLQNMKNVIKKLNWQRKASRVTLLYEYSSGNQVGGSPLVFVTIQISNRRWTVNLVSAGGLVDQSLRRNSFFAGVEILKYIYFLLM